MPSKAFCSILAEGAIYNHLDPYLNSIIVLFNIVLFDSHFAKLVWMCSLNDFIHVH